MEWHNLDGGAADFSQKTIQDGSFHQDLPPCARALAEDDVRDSLTFGKRNQTISRATRFDANNRRTELFCERDVSPERSRVLRPNATWRLPRGLDVHGVARCAEPFGNPCSRPDHARRIGG
jgi:hypothetical protein